MTPVWGGAGQGEAGPQARPPGSPQKKSPAGNKLRGSNYTSHKETGHREREGTNATNVRMKFPRASAKKLLEGGCKMNLLDIIKDRKENENRTRREDGKGVPWEVTSQGGPIVNS